MSSSTSGVRLFTPYQIFIIAVLSFLQFTVILDFMVLSPLGAILMPKLKITTEQFGLVVSAYAFSAGATGFLAAGFADKFDRKKFLIFFYIGFLIGTLLCALADDYAFLLAARIVTGIFGGVVGSVCFAIVTDLFKLEVRGRVMAFIQMSFAASQILGLPIGLWLANRYGWNSSFWMIAVVGAAMGVVLILFVKPINEHLKLKSERNAFAHLFSTISHSNYLKAFLATTLLATGGFMLMPFGSAFSTGNLGLTLDQLPVLYGVTGLSAIIVGPILGKLNDSIGRFNVFLGGTLLSIIIVFIYTQLGVTPLWVCMILNILLFIGINARMISSSTIASAIPKPQDRGAFMSINASVQQLSGGVAAYAAGLIVYQNSNGLLERYEVLGYVVNTTMLITLFMIFGIDQYVKSIQPAVQQKVKPSEIPAVPD